MFYFKREILFKVHPKHSVKLQYASFYLLLLVNSVREAQLGYVLYVKVSFYFLLPVSLTHVYYVPFPYKIIIIVKQEGTKQQYMSFCILLHYKN